MARHEPYERAAAALVAASGVTVRKYRSGTTGRAYTNADDWGIDVPRPRGPISFATFAHEVAHQLLHRSNSAPRWLEEVEAWEFALAQFERFELRGVERARLDAAACVRYAVWKALRRRCKPETARTMLGRLPEWTWLGDKPLEVMFAADLEGRLRERAAE